MSEALLFVDDVAADYSGAVVALEQASLRVDRGDIISLVGMNGAGKTTLLRAIANLLPAQRGHVTRGHILFEGQEVTRRSSDALVRAGLASVLEGRHCFASLTVEENLLTGAIACGTSRWAARDDLDRVYDLFPSLVSRRRLLAGQVSGGEQQMTAIGRALMSRPRLLLLDEPSMGLAPLVARAIYETLTRLNKETGLAVLIAEQNLVLADRFQHRAVGLVSGRTTSVAEATRRQFEGIATSRNVA